MKIMIREINRTDKNFFISSCEDFYSSPAVIHSVPKQNFEKTFDLLMDKTPYARCFICEKDGERVAYFLLAVTYSNECGGIVIWGEEMYVKPEFRSHGIGREFFSYVENEYKDVAKRFRLEVTEENTRAAALYEKLGYGHLDYLQMIKE
jgi:GNAT superfamily N-acetyltransferase